MSQDTTQSRIDKLIEIAEHFRQVAERFRKICMVARSKQAMAYNQLCILTNVPEKNRYSYLCKFSKDHGMTDQEEIDNLIGWADIIRQYPNAPNCALDWKQLCEDIGISAKDNCMLEALVELPPEVQDKWKILGYCSNPKKPIGLRTDGCLDED